VLVMSVNPGFGGQSFIPRSAAKIAEIRGRLDAASSPALIAVDGGVDAGTAPIVVAAGARVLIAGTAIFGGKPGRAAQALAELRAAATAACPC
jgi:ribulose-phosphate 3-epimerase